MGCSEEDTNMLDQSEYILCKCDKNYTLTYVNGAFCELTGWKYEEVIGKELFFFRHPDVPQSFNQFIAFKIDDQGFFNGYVRCIDKQQQGFWLFIDSGRRYTKDGELLGYEYVGYRPSERGVVYFEQLYAELLSIEGNSPDESGVTEAYDHLLRHIKSMDVSYDEFVCTAQKVQ